MGWCAPGVVLQRFPVGGDVAGVVGHAVGDGGGHALVVVRLGFALLWLGLVDGVVHHGVVGVDVVGRAVDSVGRVLEIDVAPGGVVEPVASAWVVSELVV